MGTYDALHFASPVDYLRDVLALMSTQGISAIPLLNEAGEWGGGCVGVVLIVMRGAAEAS